MKNLIVASLLALGLSSAFAAKPTCLTECTPRVGIVTTEKLTAGAPLTPYDAMQAPGNLWNTAVSRCGCASPVTSR